MGSERSSVTAEQSPTLIAERERRRIPFSGQESQSPDTTVPQISRLVHGSRSRPITRQQISHFSRSEDGGFAIMAALLMPVFIVMMGVIFDVGMLLAQHQEVDRLAGVACSRAVKPTRTMTPADSTRQTNVEKLFDTLVSDARLNVTARTVRIDWLDTFLEATVRYQTLFASIVRVASVEYEVRKHCVGIPPYPRDKEVILSSNFVKPDGSKIPMKYGCWGIYKHREFGWDEGTGPGVEIQDWGGGCFGKLPTTDFPSQYVVELDSDEAADTNSSITKIIELHPGNYEFAVWYNGRIADTKSNIIGVYLQQTRPTIGDKVNLFRMSYPASKGWVRFVTNVAVERYSIYKLSIAAEGTDDTYGGLINSFTVRYVDR